MRPRFPFNPLAEAADNPPATELARQIGLHRRTIHRWRAAGCVPDHQADRAAGALGHHPAEIWPIEWSATR